jgi:type IV pilus assembly protein PilM
MIGWKLKRRGLRPIGLDIGRNSIKMIQLATNGGHIGILAADKVRVEANGNGGKGRGFVISAIKRMLAEGNFCGRDVVSYLPNDRLKITSVRLAETETDKIKQALRMEVGERLGLDPDRDVINYLVAGNVQDGGRSKNELILFAASDETIRSHIEMLEEAQLRPVAIDTVPCALFRCFERSLRREEDREQTVVFVDVGSQFTTVVFGRGGEINFTRQIAIGGEKFNREISSKLGVSIDEVEILREKLRTESTIKAEMGLGMSESNSTWQSSEVAVRQKEQNGNGHSAEDIQLPGYGLGLRRDERAFEALCRNPLDVSTRQVIVDAISAAVEELAREISLCLRYYTVTFRGKRVERAVLSGEEGNEKILFDVLKRQLPIEIEIAQPLGGLDMTNVNFDSDRRGLLCEWAVAVGLSLKGWDKDHNNYERN